MKLEFKLDISEQEIKDAFEPRLNAVLAATTAELTQRAHTLAGQSLKSGLKHWEKGFKVDRIDDDHFVISVQGKLAMMMENGMEAGEISDMIMNGNRAKANAAGYVDANTGNRVKKNYVDVPIGKDADAAGNFSKSKVNVKSFADADSLRKYVAFSDYKKGGIKQEKRTIQRVEDIIKSSDADGGGKTSYMTIRRVTEDSVWPKSSTEGAQVLKDLEGEIESIFNSIADRLI